MFSRIKTGLKTSGQIGINVTFAFDPFHVDNIFELSSLVLDLASYLAPGFDPLTFPAFPAWAERVPLPALPGRLWSQDKEGF